MFILFLRDLNCRICLYEWQGLAKIQLLFPNKFQSGDAEPDLFQSCGNHISGKTIIHLRYSFQHYIQIIKELEDEKAELCHHKLPDSHKSNVYIYCFSANRYKRLNLK